MEVDIEPLWAERSFGALEGRSFSDIYQLQPAVDFSAPYLPVGETGESQVDLYLRASQALQKLIRQPQGSYLIVSHGSILNKTLFVILGITPQGHGRSPTFHFANLSYAHLNYDETSLRWRWIGFTSPEQWDGKLERSWST
jgi:broad specificity phosphatase PhoE